MTEDEAWAALEQRIKDGLQLFPRLRVIEPDDFTYKTGWRYWLGYLLQEPRDATYTVPGRLACRLLRRHNTTCLGRRDHPRRW